MIGIIHQRYAAISKTHSRFSKYLACAPEHERMPARPLAAPTSLAPAVFVAPAARLRGAGEPLIATVTTP